VALHDGAGEPAGRSTTAVLAGPDEFTRRADPFRAELLAHCSRMLGSVQDAEDQVQETYLRAWRSYGDFEGRSSLRTWLYRIATNVCLTALDGRRRLPVPSGLPESERDDGPAPWPDTAAELRAADDPDLADPAAVILSREQRAGALAVAWRHLSPRQWAVLVLRDVLGLQAVEIADLLGTSGAAVHSMVRRARAQLAQVSAADATAEPDGAGERRLLEAYAAAFETGDIGTLVGLLADDAVCTQTTTGTVATGPDEILPLLEHCPAFGECRLVPVVISGKPGFGIYRRGGDGRYRAYMIDVLTVSSSGLKRVDVVEDRTLFAAFGLPQVHPGAATA
jgi:RNA polymerase sigma-70 factor (ECF subfamily)